MGARELRLAASELRAAAQKGDCGKLRELLDGDRGGASVVDKRTEVRDQFGGKSRVTALLQAVHHGQHAAVELLLERKANPNLQTSLGYTPLMIAARGGHLRILQTLLKHEGTAIDAVNPEHDCTAFHMACGEGQADCAVELARRSCDMTMRDKYGNVGKDIAERQKHTAVLEGLRAHVLERPQESGGTLQGYQNMTPIMVVGIVIVLALLLLLWPANGVLNLREAAEKGDCATMRQLLDGGGASVVDERTEITDTETGKKFWTTALFEAVVYKQHAAVELLLEHGANPNIADSGGITPLMIAASLGHLTILQALLDHAAIDINAVDPVDGSTAFIHACDMGYADCAVELSRRGCDTTLQDKDGNTGKDFAELMKHTAVLEGLRALAVEQKTQTTQKESEREKRREKKKKQSRLQANSTTTAHTANLLTAQDTALELREAAQKGNRGKLRELLDGGGASVVDERTEITDEKFQKFWTTALLEAVGGNQQAAVDLLLEHNADPNRVDSRGYTPLMQAAGVGHLAIMRMLLDSEAIAIDAAYPETGFTAFHYACFNGHADCAEELARRGCDTTLRTKRGETGKDIAERNKRKAVLEGLRVLAVEHEQQQEDSSPAMATTTATAIAEELYIAARPDSYGIATLMEAAYRIFTPLMSMQAGGHDNLPILSTLLDHDAAIAIDTVDPETDAMTLHKICLEGSDCTVEPVQHGYDTTSSRGKYGWLHALSLGLLLVFCIYLALGQLLRPETDATAEAPTEVPSEAEPELDEGTQQLQSLTELGVQQWSAAQVLEWVTLADLPPESISVVTDVIESLDIDGRDFLDLASRMLQKKLTRHGSQDADALAKQVIEQRDALLLPGDSTSSQSTSPQAELSGSLECPICMELYGDDEPGLRVPRILTSCGHTVCHGCIANMLTRVLAEGNAKPYKCPTCSKVTKVARGKAGCLPKNFALAAALEALQ